MGRSCVWLSMLLLLGAFLVPDLASGQRNTKTNTRRFLRPQPSSPARQTIQPARAPLQTPTRNFQPPPPAPGKTRFFVSRDQLGIREPFGAPQAAPLRQSNPRPLPAQPPTPFRPSPPRQRPGPLPPSAVATFRPSPPRHRGPPGQVPPGDIAKKLNEAFDFRALARKLLHLRRSSIV